MATARWSTPTTNLMNASRVIDRMFDQFFCYGQTSEQEQGGTTPYALPVDVLEFERQGRWLRQERPWGNWTRKLELPKEVQADGIQADVENGMLRLTVPKAVTAQPVKIPIGAGKHNGKQPAQLHS